MELPQSSRQTREAAQGVIRSGVSSTEALQSGDASTGSSLIDTSTTSSESASQLGGCRQDPCRGPFSSSKQWLGGGTTGYSEWSPITGASSPCSDLMKLATWNIRGFHKPLKQRGTTLPEE